MRDSLFLCIPSEILFKFMSSILFVDLLAKTIDSGASYNIKLLHTLLQDAKISSVIFDWNSEFPEKVAPDMAAQKILTYSLQIVAFSTITCNFLDSLIISREIKRLSPQILVLFGGPQASIVADKLISRFSWIDAVSIGESETKIVTLVQGLLSGDYEILSHINGLAFRRDGQATADYSCDTFTDLNSLPRIDYSDNLAGPNPSVYVETARGCYSRCTYCSTSRYWANNSVRYRTPSQVIRQISELLGEKSLRRGAIFWLTHDNFTQNQKWLAEFLDKAIVLKQKFPDFSWACSSRPDVLHTSVIDRMKKAGCCRIFCGFESGASDIHDRIRKNIDLSRGLSNAKYATKLGFQVVTSFIIGFPFDTKETLNATFSLALKLRLSNCHVQFHRLVLLPGTAMFNDFTLEQTMICSDIAVYSGDVVSRLKLGKEEIKKLIEANVDMMPYYYPPLNQFGISSDSFSFLDKVVGNFMINAYPMSLHILSEQISETFVDFCLEFERYLEGKLNLSERYGLKFSQQKVFDLSGIEAYLLEFAKSHCVPCGLFEEVLKKEHLRLRESSETAI